MSDGMGDKIDKMYAAIIGNSEASSITVPVSLRTNASEPIILYGTITLPFSAQSVIVNKGSLDTLTVPSPYTPNTEINYSVGKGSGVHGAFSGTITFSNVKF